VAYALNRINYGGRHNWNTLFLILLVMFYGKHIKYVSERVCVGVRESEYLDRLNVSLADVAIIDGHQCSSTRTIATYGPFLVIITVIGVLVALGFVLF